MSHWIDNFWSDNAHHWNNALVTRFPPEPSGFAHLGHAFAASVNVRMARAFGGVSYLRMDDTNPEAESLEFVEAIKNDLKWLGLSFESRVTYASDYFPIMYELANRLIKEGLAYIDCSDKETLRANRGSFIKAGVRSEDASRSIEWHLSHFEAMHRGDFEEGHCVLRAKIDMASPNMNLRDPIIYRIKKAEHYRTKDLWKIMPSYDFAHPVSDFVEGTTLSLCSLEFEDHRPLYDWVVLRCEDFLAERRTTKSPVEMEFARLELDHGTTSKRKIKAWVESGRVTGFDDPRLLTLAGLRRRGVTASAILAFCEAAGVSKANSTTPLSRLDDFLRLECDPVVPRRIVIKDPVHLIVMDGPEESYVVEARNHPKDESLGSRSFTVDREYWLEREDIRAAGTAEKGFKRVEPGAYFRIMNALELECLEVVLDEAGKIIKVLAKKSTTKPRCTIHGLAMSAAVSVSIWEPKVISEEEVFIDADKLVAGDPKDDRHTGEIRELIDPKALGFSDIGDVSKGSGWYSGFCEPLALKTLGTWQAVRYGYCTVDVKNKGCLILAASLKSGV